MILQKLRLFNFRVYSEELFTPEPGLNVLVGPNGAGKTAILEALHLLSAARSFRAGRENELCRWGSSSCQIEGRLETDEGHQRRLSLAWRRIDGEWQKNAGFQGDSVAKLSDFLGCIPLSLFTPQDLELINGAPSARRRYLDLIQSKLSPIYLQDLARLKKVLSSRNAVLRQNRHPRELAPWNELLFTLSHSVSQKREALVERLSNLCSRLHPELNGQDLGFKLSYKPCCPNEKDEFFERLSLLEEREFQRGNTLLSPQKDELEVTYRDKSLRRFGSQGEHRLGALCLRLAQAEILAEEKGEKAILLLDDAYSELDPDKRERLSSLLPRFSQVFLTTSSLADFPKHNACVHKVEEAQVMALEV